MSTSQNNLNAVFNDIATAINTKGVSGTMTPVEMADKISSIPSGESSIIGESKEAYEGCVTNPISVELTHATTVDFGTAIISAQGTMINYSNSAVEVESNTSLTSSVSCKIGDTVVCCFVIRDSSTNFSISNDWTMISYSDYCSGDNYYQRLGWAYKTATSTTESVTVTQSSSGRIYINLVAFTPNDGEIISLTDNNYNYETGSSSITVTKPNGLTIWGCSCAFSGSWTVSNNCIQIKISSSNPRLLTALDSSSDNSVTFSMTQGAIIVGSLTITGTKFLAEV